MMKIFAASMAAAGVCASGTASAQSTVPTGSSVTFYGAIDTALVWVNNAGGHSLTKVDTAGNWASRWGVRGREDLGGGLSAVFTLEGGFNSDDGTLGQGGVGFGRQSWVGLSHATLGTVTVGRQYDFVYAIPPDIVMVIGGLAGAVGGAGTTADMHLGGTRYNNSIKWVGNYGPMTFGAMYGLGNENGADRMTSFMAGYRSGPLNVGIAYTRDNFSPVKPFVAGNEVLVATAHYDITPNYRLIALLGKSKADQPGDTNTQNKLAEIGLIQRFTSAFSVGYVLGQANTRNAADVPGRIREYGVGAYYDFSRRTTVYGIATAVHTSGSAGNAYSSIAGIGGSPATSSSTTHQQTVLKVGIRHFF